MLQTRLVQTENHTVDAKTISDIIVARLQKEKSRLKKDWETSRPVTHFMIDDLLPEEIVDQAIAGIPTPEKMRHRHSIRENKYTSTDPSEWGEVCKAILFGMHSKEVLKQMAEITGIKDLIGDETFYGSGVSWMGKGQFLNPHLDNSGHPSIPGYRRLNALFYVAKNWTLENGGNLELWTPEMTNRVEVLSRFNRLVIMNTNRKSLHSVNKVLCESPRLCLSNYYYTHESPDGEKYSHITSFRGRPEERLRDFVLRAEGVLGSILAKFIRK